MKADDLAQVKREMADVPWDEVKEQRVLGRVLAERRAPRGRSRVVVLVPAVAAAAVFFLVGLFALGPWRQGRDATALVPSAVANAPTASPIDPPPAAAEQTMALSDGSQAVLVRDAGLQIEEQRADLVRIHQKRGVVRYEVRPDPQREFTVRAGSSVVRVRGTVFTVDLAPEATTISVSRGRVEVEDGDRKRELSAGESLRVPTSVPADAEMDAEAPSVNVGAQEPRGTSRAPSAADLLAKADAARLKGNAPEAAAALTSLITAYPRDSRVPAALFSLARVERSRGRDAAAAKAFERCVKAAPQGPLAEDALAEAAVSWSAAGAGESARAAAASYLARYPRGAHLPRMKPIANP